MPSLWRNIIQKQLEGLWFSGWRHSCFWIEIKKFSECLQLNTNENETGGNTHLNNPYYRMSLLLFPGLFNIPFWNDDSINNLPQWKIPLISTKPNAKAYVVNCLQVNLMVQRKKYPFKIQKASILPGKHQFTYDHSGILLSNLPAIKSLAFKSIQCCSREKGRDLVDAGRLTLTKLVRSIMSFCL